MPRCQVLQGYWSASLARGDRCLHTTVAVEATTLIVFMRLLNLRLAPKAAAAPRMGRGPGAWTLFAWAQTRESGRPKGKVRDTMAAAPLYAKTVLLLAAQAKNGPFVCGGFSPILFSAE